VVVSETHAIPSLKLLMNSLNLSDVFEDVLIEKNFDRPKFRVDLHLFTDIYLVHGKGRDMF